ncbi:MAG: hypothetical protein ABI665_10980 [Vicinamibacterales bacterium]
MRSPAAAIAWEFHHRHRWELMALAVYLLVLGAFKLLIIGPGHVRLDPPNGLAALAIVPFSVTFMYGLAVFSFGLSGNLAARPSIYPARMFTLPMTTAALAGWPMLYGTAAMASLWLLAALLARWPWGIDLPFIWPAMLAAAFLAWTQALMWMPYGLAGMRVIVAVSWLVTLDAVVFVAIDSRTPEPLIAAFLAPQIPLAYLAAWYAVRRARRGDVPDWRIPVDWLGRISDVLPRRRDDFSSPASAQRWFEWRRHGRTLPGWVAILLPFELGLLFIVESPVFVSLILIGVLLTPPWLASLVAGSTSRPNPDGRDSYGVTPFTATRPMTSAALVAAKLHMAIWSTLAAWLLVAVAIPIALALSGTAPLVIETAREIIDGVGTPRAIVVGLLGCSGLLASTWKRLAQSLCIGLTGREWLVRSSLFLTLSFLVVIGPVSQWIHDDRAVRAALWDAWPWILAVLAGFKMSAATWVATRLYRLRLLSDRTLMIGAAGWMAAVLALYGLLVWVFSTPFVPSYVLALVAILAIPLARVSAAPLALAWNRHR